MTVYKSYSATPFFYTNGLGISNNATTPLTKLDIATGSVVDSTGTYQLVNSASITINAAINGLNGLDTGSFAASKVYAVFIIADPVTLQATGAMLSLSYTAPLMPFGYSAFALIGFATTDAAVHFLPGYWTDSDSSCRLFMYDAPQATAITTGASTTYVAIDLSALVPTVQNIPVWIAYDMLPAAASRIMSLQPAGATGDAFSATSQVTSVHFTGNALVMARLASSLPKISYKWSAGGGDSVAINVAGYQFYL